MGGPRGEVAAKKERFIEGVNKRHEGKSRDNRKEDRRFSGIISIAIPEGAGVRKTGGQNEDPLEEEGRREDA